MRYYTIKTSTGEAHLKITLATQIKWKQTYKMNAVGVLFSCMDDIEKLVAVLTDALNWKGNDNPITDGAELYEAVVENGGGGMGYWQKTLAAIGQASGLLDEKETAAINRKADAMLADIFDDEDEDEAKN